MVVPEGWEVKLLGDIGYFSKGQGINRDNMHSGAIPCIRYGEIYTHHNNYIKKFYSHISIEVSKDSRKLRTGELLFAASGETKEDIGKCVAFIDNCEAYAGSDIIIFTPETDINSLFLGYYLNSEYVKHQKSSKGQGDAIVHILAHSLAEIMILLPPLPEQLRIAEVLSDTDLYITTLERLIAKKEAVKQGVMQELLTGKRRLPGFTDTWVEKQLGNVTNIFKGHGLSKAKIALEGCFHCILYGELFTEYNEIITSITSRTNYIEGVPSVKGDILIPASTTTIGIDLAKASVIPFDNVLLGGDINIIRPNDKNINSIFLAMYIMYTKKMEISIRAKGSTVYHLHGKDLFDLSLCIPPTLAEQTAIAEILSDMDAELSALQKKLEKIRLIKQGMMDALLTGKICLPEDKPNVQFTQRKEPEEILYAAEKTEEYTAKN